MNPPSEIYQQQLAAAEKKAALPLGKMLALGFLAGACIAFGAATSNMAAHGVANYGLARLVAGSVFPVGLILIVLVGAELFTGNNLMEMALVERRITAGRMLRNLVWVWLSNLAGSVAVAACVWGSGEWGSAGHALGAYTIKVAAGKAALAPGAAVCSGILCNVLVCLAILAAASSKQTIGKIFAIWFPIMAFVLGGFEHSVANMYYLPAGLMALSDPVCAAKAAELGIATGALTVAHAARNLLFVTIGNLVGGMVFVGDNLRKDVLGSTAAGLRGVWLQPDASARDARPETPSVATLSDLAALLPRSR